MTRNSFQGGGGLDFGWDQWRRDPSRNPSLSPMNDDMRVLDMNQRNHELAQQIMRKGQADEAMRRNLFLQSFANRPVNIHGAPRNPQEKLLQEVLQADQQAGVRGWNAQLQQRDLNRQQYDRNLNNQVKIRNQALDEVKWQDARDYRERVFDYETQADERKRMENYLNTIAKLRGDSTKGGDAEYAGALRLIEKGVPLAQIRETFPRLSSDHLRRLEMVQGAMMEGKRSKAAPKFEQGRTLMESYNRALAGLPEKTNEDYEADLDSRDGWFSSRPKYDEAEYQRMLEENRRQLMADFAEDSNARKFGAYNPEMDAFVPFMDPVLMQQEQTGIPAMRRPVRSPDGYFEVQSEAEAEMFVPRGQRFRLPNGKTGLKY